MRPSPEPISPTRSRGPKPRRRRWPAPCCSAPRCCRPCRRPRPRPWSGRWRRRRKAAASPRRCGLSFRS
ncbi:MAG: hypothetical protein EXQ90_05475 [Rhodospirillales bacterium]|nr:hypothetical protein [Rhodospirillales bacterium]